MAMYVIRPAKLSDFDSLLRFAEQSGVGMTHLPCQESLLRQKLANLTAVSTLKNQDYLFVLADSENDNLGGTSGVNASVGSTETFHVFSIENMPPLSSRTPLMLENRLLRLKEYQEGPSELCSLFLSPQLRSGGWGKLLSWSRFLFMANFPDRFQSTTMANIRGVIKDDSSIFWEGLGRCFLDMNFTEMMKFRLGHQIKAAEIFPSFPLPVALLSQETRKVMGQAYSQSEPALKMLLEEGFEFLHEIDPYDGGPIIQASTANILAIKNSAVGMVGEIKSSNEEKHGIYSIICNTKLDFRACYGYVKVLSGNNIALAKEVASALQVEIGSHVRYLNIK